MPAQILHNRLEAIECMPANRVVTFLIDRSSSHHGLYRTKYLLDHLKLFVLNRYFLDSIFGVLKHSRVLPNNSLPLIIPLSVKCLVRSLKRLIIKMVDEIKESLNVEINHNLPVSFSVSRIPKKSFRFCSTTLPSFVT